MKRICILTLLCATAVSFAHADQLTLGAATGYNVFVFNNFSEYTTDSQGKMAVGGNFAPANGGGFTIASNGSAGAGTYGLVVGGNFTNNGYNMGGGDIYVGGSMNWTNPSAPNNAYVVGNVTNTGGGSEGGTIYYGGTYSGPSYISHQSQSASSLAAVAPINFLSAQTSLDNLSASLAGDTANGTVSLSSSTYTLTGTSSTLNVFNMSASSYNAATINVTAPAGSTVVINVAGTADSFNSGSINLSGVSASNVIFNFNSATSLNLTSIGWYGTILAPYATFTGSYGQINGQLIASSATGTTEFHDTEFAGNLGSSSSSNSNPQSVQLTPEPSTWLLLLTGAGAVVFLKRRA